jgi:hypothetical protein
MYIEQQQNGQDLYLKQRTNDLKTFFDKHLVAENVLIIGVANYAHRVFVLNWHESLRRNTDHSDKVVVICLDPQLYDYLKERKIPALPITDILLDEDFKRYYLEANTQKEQLWEEKGYYRLTNAKIRIVYEIMSRFGYSILFSDVDLVWMHPKIVDFILFHSHAGSYDFLYTTQELYQFYNMCTGFYFAKNTPLVLGFLRNVVNDPEIERNNDQYIAHDYYLALRLEDRTKFHWCVVLTVWFMILLMFIRLVLMCKLFACNPS